MSKSIISEGKTTNEAIETGLKELNVSKNMVDIKVLENEDKRSFFSILTPRVVKVQLTIKEEKYSDNSAKIEKKEIEISEEDKEKAKKNVEKFLKEFFEKVQKDVAYEVSLKDSILYVSVNNEKLGFLIGYRGETLYSFQNILVAVASRDIKSRIKVILDIEGYKEKREKALEDLAEKIAKTVIKTKKSVTLEPMQAYERKIIHTKLQDNDFVETRSIGEEPRRKVVIELKKK